MSLETAKSCCDCHPEKVVGYVVNNDERFGPVFGAAITATGLVETSPSKRRVRSLASEVNHASE